MKEYVMTLLGASLLSGIVGTLCPKKHQKYLRLLCGLCVIAVMVSPLPSYLADAEDEWLDAYDAYGETEQQMYEEIYQQTLLTADGAAIGTYLQSALMRELSLGGEDVSVSVTVSQAGEQLVVTRVRVSLSGKGIFVDPRAVTAYVEAMLGCPCEVVYA